MEERYPPGGEAIEGEIVINRCGSFHIYINPTESRKCR